MWPIIIYFLERVSVDFFRIVNFTIIFVDLRSDIARSIILIKIL